MAKRVILGLVLSALFTASAFAAQNVANTSQKGSLLFFPLIDIRAEDVRSTIVEISNDANATVEVNCNYINEKKGRVDFQFSITPKQTTSWDVLTHSGDIAAPEFPLDGTFPGDAAVGELICFAVDAAGSEQVRFNHLSGTATVISFADLDARQAKQAFKYNAWSFTARSTEVPPPADGTPVGTPGYLVLSGAGDGTYDACPAYLIGNFSPSGASVGGVTYLDNNLSVSICKQDLRQDFTPHCTKLGFDVWNGFEESFSGAYQCSDSVLTFGLDPEDPPNPLGATVNAQNFTFSTLQTAGGRFQVQGIASGQGTEDTGLVAVLTTSMSIGGGTTEDAELGSTLHGAGVAVNSSTGFVLWDPAGGIVPESAYRGAAQGSAPLPPATQSSDPGDCSCPFTGLTPTSDGHQHRDAHGHAYRDADSHQHRDADGHAYRDPHGHAYRDADGHPYRDPHGHAYRDADGHAYRDADGHAYRDADGHAYRDADGHAYRDPDGHAYRDADGARIARRRRPRLPRRRRPRIARRRRPRLPRRRRPRIARRRRPRIARRPRPRIARRPRPRIARRPRPRIARRPRPRIARRPRPRIARRPRPRIARRRRPRIARPRRPRTARPRRPRIARPRRPRTARRRRPRIPRRRRPRIARRPRPRIVRRRRPRIARPRRPRIVRRPRPRIVRRRRPRIARPRRQQPQRLYRQ